MNPNNKKMADPYNTIIQYLKLQNFHYLEKWVRECVDYFQSNRPNLSTTQLQKEVHQQWLYLNLRDLKLAALPPNLKTQTKVTLPGKYALQVENLWDCGQSMYSQWQTLRNASIENVNATKKTSDEAPARRCLRMNLTDGVQEISAMEYDFIPALKWNNPEQPPGFKILVIGPVVCRKGMLLLKSENVKVLGGEVDVFYKTHSLAATLASSLGIEIDTENVNSASRKDGGNDLNLLDGSDDFIMDDFNLDITANANEPPTSHNLNNRPTNEGMTPDLRVNNNRFSSSNQNSNNFDNEFEEYPVPPVNSYENQIPKSKPTSNLSSNHSMGDGLNNYFSDADDEVLCLEDNLNIPNCRNQQPRNSVISTISQNIATNLMESKNSKRSNSPNANRTTMLNSKSRVPPKRQTSIDSFLQSSHLNATTSNSDNEVGSTIVMQTVKTQPFVYLAQIVSLNLKEDIEFKVKAIILTLLTKISIKNDEFTLQAKICDGTISLNVIISSKILENLLGFSACEKTILMREKSHNAAVAERLRSAFSFMQKKLISLNSILVIRFFRNKEMPMVMSIEDLTQADFSYLLSRKIT